MKEFFINLYYEASSALLLPRASGNEATDNIQQAADKVRDTLVEVFTILTPIVFVLIGAFVVFKMVMIGLKIAKSADEPEERSRYIKAMIWWALGLIICVLAATLVPTLLQTLLPTGK